MQEIEQTASAQAESFGVSLSGGGFRATLFHLGVVRLLYETGLLERVQFISGVSGGGILAAHLGMNWSRYTATPEEFEAAANEIVRFTQRDVRNRILRRWIIGWLTLLPRLLLNWSRVELLRGEYRSLYGDRQLSEFPNVYNGDGPRIILQCASMTTGLPCSLGRSGLMLYKEQAEGRGINLAVDEELTFATSLTVAHGVAACSAFPPMFPPLKIDSELLGCPKRAFPSVHYLTDGGVFDNLGMDRPLRWYLQQHPHAADQIKTFLISDAEGPFNQVVGKPWRFKFMLPRNVRATEVLMKRVSTLNWKYLAGLDLNLIRIPKPPVGESSPTGLEFAQAMRTDLDRFSDLEIEELVQSGHRAARSALAEKHWIADSTPDSTWCPVTPSTMSPVQRERELESSRFRRWRPLLFGFSDGAWWILCAIFALFVYLYASRR